MKKILAALCCFFIVPIAGAKHITGGEMIYQFTGQATANSKYYRITLRLFRDENCSGCADMPPSVFIGIFNNTDNSRYGNYREVPLSAPSLVPQNELPNCITNPPNLQYRVGYYTFVVEIPDNDAGYTATYQTCCRIDNIGNVPNSIGATYSASIPGRNRLGGGSDNSPQFAMGISVVCHNRPFTLDFSATDQDGDSLVYSFCSAYGGGAAADASYSTPAGPPYASVSYINGYTGTMPLGTLATINSQTGIISGIAPPAGKYVVSVCVDSYNRTTGQWKGTHRKDFIITVAPCDFAGAELEPEGYTNCQDLSMTFENLNNSPLNQTYYWDFGDPASPDNISFDETPTHLFSAAGVYTIKLVVNRGNNCSDSTTSIVRVFPGYFPAIAAPPTVCRGVPVNFNDNTTANYGAANSWRWDFGVENQSHDTSRIQNPQWTYSETGTYTVRLIVGSDRGCIDTAYHTINVTDRPTFSITNDTLICTIDTLQLSASSSNPGNITWSPNYMISDVNSDNPLVSPDVTTTYIASYSDAFGCTAIDSVRVNVVSEVTLALPADTTICQTDPVVLNTEGDGLSYEWSPAATLNDPAIPDPVATPLTNTVYTVTSRIGKCSKTGSISIRVVPYPVVTTSPDVQICFGDDAFISASGGSIYSWSPLAFLQTPNAASSVVVRPTGNVQYTVTVRDTLGCPKPVRGTVNLNVIKVDANAGPRDTSVVLGQPLQLNATGGLSYSWTPSQWLNNSSIPNPVSLPEDNIEYIVSVTGTAGCAGSDTILVKLFKVQPDLYVPTAFSPDGDGLNDIFRPIPIGMRSIDAFRIYNRWGQMLFSTTEYMKGWDGTFGGMPQSAGTYVWLAEGTDYRGVRIQRKGTVILIR